MTVAAFACAVKQTGAAVALSGEATTSLGGDVYQVTNTAKRILDPDTAITVYDGATPIADTAVTVDYLFGKVTLSSTPAGTVTIDGAYLPSFAVAEARAFELSFTKELADSTLMASGTTSRARTALLKDCSGSISSLDNLLTDLDTGVVPFTDQQAGTRRVLEITFPTSGQIFRAFVKFEGISQSASIDALLESTLNFQASAATGTDQTEGDSFGFSS
jgi:hypothetical protein